LESARLVRAWAHDTLFREAEVGKRVVVCLRSIERFFAWIQWRRILVRWEYHAHNFLGFVQLACLVILSILR
jgi:hypothetical protein